MGSPFDWGDLEPGRDFDRRPFLFRHALAAEPLFGAGRLAELAARGASGPLALDREPEYRPLLDRCRAELRAAIPALRREGTPVATLACRVSGTGGGFEIDPASGFIFLLDGAATVRIFDLGAIDIPGAYDLERFYQHGASAVAESLERRAAEPVAFRLGPGDSLHRPRHTAWTIAADGPGPALALELALVTRAARREEAAHRVNGLLRIAGLNARPPGRSPATDRIKQAALAVGRLVQPLVERVTGTREG